MFLSKNFVYDNVLADFLKLVSLALLACVLYCSICMLLKVEELKEIWQLFKNRNKNRIPDKDEE